MRDAILHEFDRIQNLMEASFPADERRTAEEQRKVWEDPRFHCYVMEDNEQILGFMTIWQFDGWAYAEHLATNPAIRNQGIGSRILTEIKTLVDGQLCLEVEHPDNDMARRRIGFYERHGLVYNDYPYLQPPMRAGQDMLPLRLMTKPSAIDAVTYERYKKQIYRIVYKYEGE